MIIYANTIIIYNNILKEGRGEKGRGNGRRLLVI